MSATSDTFQPTHAPELSETLLQMISGVWISQAIYVAAKLGIADLLKEGAKSSKELAQVTAVDERSLYRILRALASVGIFAEVENQFELTPMAEYLRTDAPASLRAIATMFGGEAWHWQPWGEILYSVQTGKPAFDRVSGMPIFPYLSQNPEAATLFDRAMTSFSSNQTQAIMSGYDFSTIKTLVDVGGGHGSLLAAILQANPTLKGMVYDQTQVVAGAEQSMKTKELDERCQCVGGNFFESVPSGGDAYMMKHILHDWDDEQAIALLQNCHRAMPANGKILVIEHVIPTGNEPFIGKLLDLEMLIMTAGGRERSAKEFEQLFATASFKLTNIVPTQAPVSIVEGVKLD